MPWWGWVTVGALLLTTELAFVDAGFYLVFLGVAALLVGLVELAGFTGPGWLQWLLFAVLAVGSLVLFRGRLSDRLHKGLGEVPRNVENEVATALENIAPGSRGQVELRGSQWLAQNDGGTPIESGQAVHVDRAEGVTLHVRGENS